MPLLKDIIAEAISPNGDVPRMLRLCMLLAAKLDNEPLRQWTRHELHGYPDEVEVPSYRQFEVRSKGNFIGPLGSWQATLEISLLVLPEELRPRYRTHHARQTAAGYASLAAEAIRAGESSMALPWAPLVARRYAPTALAAGTQCTSAWMEITTAEMVGMIDQIKSRTLDFALEIQREFPEVDLDAATPTPPESIVTHTFHTTIQGNVQNYAAGSSDFSQTSAMEVKSGDWESLAGFLRTTGIQERDVAELQTSLAEDQAQGAAGIGERAKRWLADMSIKAAQGAAGVGGEVIGGAVTKAVLTHLGLSG